MVSSGMYQAARDGLQRHASSCQRWWSGMREERMMDSAASRLDCKAIGCAKLTNLYLRDVLRTLAEF
eukprot:117482-Chlamydomonas_euryale.AAC.3